MFSGTFLHAILPVTLTLFRAVMRIQECGFLAHVISCSLGKVTVISFEVQYCQREAKRGNYLVLFFA